jgi:hypothetical protein
VLTKDDVGKMARSKDGKIEGPICGVFPAFDWVYIGRWSEDINVPMPKRVSIKNIELIGDGNAN